MGKTKVLVVYYSRAGATRKLAEAIAGMLECDIEEVVDTKNRRGIIGLLVTAKDAVLRRPTVIQRAEKDPASYELVIIGAPVWAFTLCRPIRTYLSQNGGRLGEVAFFLTARLAGFARTFRHMEGLCGQTPLAYLPVRRKDVLRGSYLDRIKEFVQKIKS